MPAVYPITTYAPDQLHPYPHMAKRDAALWDRYVSRHGTEFLAFSYDIALGGRQLDVPGATAEEIASWQYATALKIDAIGWKGNQAWIFEVRPDATVSALGAVITYHMVADRERITDLPLYPVILCDNMQIDVEWACLRLGVQVIKLEP